MTAKKKWSPRKTWQRLRTVPGLGRDVGALVVVVILGFTAAGTILSQMRFDWPWGSEKFAFRVEFAQAVAVSPSNGQEVRIAGVKVGDIRGSEPTDHNTSLVTLVVGKGHTIYDNARAVLRPKNPLNEMYVEINPGGPPGKPLPPDGVIPVGQTERPIQPEEVFDHLDERSRNAIANLLGESDVALSNAPQTLPGDLNATDDTLTKLKPVVTALAARREKIRQLVTAISQISSSVGGNNERLTSLVNSLQQTLGVLAERDDQVSAALSELGGTTAELQHSMNSTSALATQANPLLDNVKAASAELPSALSRLRATVQRLGTTVDAAKPVVRDASPVVTALAPTVTNLRGSLDDLKPTTAQLGYATAQIAPWMYDLGGFTYNTNSVFSGKDVNGGFGRGHLTFDLQRPLGVPNPGDDKQYSYRQGGSPLGAYPPPGEGG